MDRFLAVSRSFANHYSYIVRGAPALRESTTSATCVYRTLKTKMIVALSPDKKRTNGHRKKEKEKKRLTGRSLGVRMDGKKIGNFSKDQWGADLHVSCGTQKG